MRLVVSLFVLMFAFQSYSAKATVSASDPASVVNALQSAGYKAVLEKDGDGDPKIMSAMSGWTVTVYFFGCEDNVKCDSIQFYAGFDRKKPISVPKFHNWLKEYRFGKAYLDNEGDPLYEWDIVLGEGVPDSVFKSSVEYFDKSLGSFGQFVFDETRSGLDTKE